MREVLCRLSFKRKNKKIAQNKKLLLSKVLCRLSFKKVGGGDNLKILMATMSMGLGGAETHVLELSLELARRGHSVTVASCGGVYVKALEAGGVTQWD